MTAIKHYAERDIIGQGQVYANHVSAMTREKLHSKSDIAAELAHRDIQNGELDLKLQRTKLQLQQLPDAFGDGYYEGFIDGAKHQDSVDLNTQSREGLAKIKDEAMRCSEIAEDQKSKRLGIPSRLDFVSALHLLFNDYKQLADSGDAGNWSLEETEVGRQTLDILNKFKSIEGNSNE